MNIGSLTWDEQGEHYYNTGIDGVAVCVWDDSISFSVGSSGTVNGWYGAPVAWNGVTAINESPSGAESNKQYADNIEYLNLLSKEEFGLTLECFQVPEEFDECDGIKAIGAMMVRAQARKPFALIYRVQKGSDTVAAGELGYTYHIVYGCKASPSSRDFSTVNESPEAQTFSYEITTSDMTNTKLIDQNANPSVTKLVHIEFDSTDFSESDLGTILNNIYSGHSTTGNDRMITPYELFSA